MSLRFPSAAILAVSLLSACRLERPDPASQAAAILHKHPSDFLDQLASLDALAAREVGALNPDYPSQAAGGRSLLAESLYTYTRRLKSAFATLAPPGGSPTDSARIGFDSARIGFDSARIAILNAFVFDSLGIVPVLEGGTLAESVPSLVLAHRRGACVGLVLLYLALGQSLDMPMVPVFLPGHLFVRHAPPAGPARAIETLRGGIARSDSFYRETFSLGKRPWYRLDSATPEQALAALVFNMGNAHLAAGDKAAAQEEYRLVEEALPGFPDALGSLGVCYRMEGLNSLAREKFLAALAGDSLSEPAIRNLADMQAPSPH